MSTYTGHASLCWHVERSALAGLDTKIPILMSAVTALFPCRKHNGPGCGSAWRPQLVGSYLGGATVSNSHAKPKQQMADGGFAFNFKVGEPPADEDSDEYLSGDDGGQEYHEEREDEYSWDQPNDETIWPSYDARTLMPSEELRATRKEVEATHDQEEVEVAPGLLLLKGRVSGAEAAELLKNTDVSTSDLLPDVYEGGFKLWEGAIDMCQYLLQKYGLTGPSLMSDGTIDSPLQGKKVLELGCGHGLPGIVALMAGAEVHFQDYNREVLARLTIPNVLTNMARLPPGRSRGAVRYFAGDWHSVGELLTSRGLGGHYDLIITSESIYSVESQRRLIECVKQVLQPPLGVVLVAAKSHYFGVGGGIKTFKQAVKHDGIFEVEHVYRTSKDVSSAMRPVVRRDETAVEEQEQQPADASYQSEAGQQQPATESQAAGSGSTDGQVHTEGLQGTTAGRDADEEQSEARNAVAGKGAEAAHDVEGSEQPIDGAVSQAEDAGGNVREVLQLTFPSAILPYFL